MKNNQIFKKYNSRFVTEGAINSALCGLAIGGGVCIIVSLICMLCNASLALFLGLSIGLWVAAAVSGGVLFYYLKFRPTYKTIARRADSVGLEERAITMLELAGDNSYIARRQREDAVLHINTVADGTLKKLVISVVAIVTAVFFTLVGAGVITVGTLMAEGVVPPIISEEPTDDRDKFIAVSYIAEEGGIIEGNEEQLILPGEDAEPVMAVADDGWAFSEWSDGVLEPYRWDLNVTEDFTVYAIFEEVEESEGSGGESNSDSNNSDSDSDDDNQKPSDNNDSDNSDDDNQQEQEGPTDDEQDPNDSESESGAGGRYEERNQVVDGNTYYRDLDYINEVLEKLTSGGELTAEEREFIEKYFGSL